MRVVVEGRRRRRGVYRVGIDQVEGPARAGMQANCSIAEGPAMADTDGSCEGCTYCRRGTVADRESLEAEERMGFHVVVEAYEEEY
jgi:hypothetical protein